MNFHATVSLCTNIEQCKSYFTACPEMIPAAAFFDGAAVSDLELGDKIKHDEVTVPGDELSGVKVSLGWTVTESWTQLSVQAPKDESWGSTRVLISKSRNSVLYSDLWEIGITGNDLDPIVYACQREAETESSQITMQKLFKECATGSLHFRQLKSHPPTPDHDFDFNVFRFVSITERVN